MTANRILYTLTCFCLLFLGSRPALAIVNVEDMAIAEPEAGVSGQVDASVNGASGNSNNVQFQGGARMQWQHGPHTDIGMASYAFGKSQGKSNANRGFAHLRHRLRLTKQWGVEGFVQAQKDEFARLLFRGLVGGGLRWRMNDAERMALYIGAGAMYERERYKAQAGTTDPLSANMVRGNLYMVFKYSLNEQARFLSTTYYQPRLSEFADFRLLEDAALKVKLFDPIDLKLSLQVQHDSRPPQSVKKTNLIYASGIEYDF